MATVFHTRPRKIMTLDDLAKISELLE